MTNKIQNKRSSTQNNPPASLDPGEIAINTNATTPHIHFEDAGGDMRSVGADPTAAGDYNRVTAPGTANEWVDLSTVDDDGPWTEAGGIIYPKTSANQVSIGTGSSANVGNAKFRVYLPSDDTGTYFHGGGSRGLKINDVTEGNDGDHTRFLKATASGQYSFSNSGGELVRINNTGVGIGNDDPGN